MTSAEKQTKSESRFLQIGDEICLFDNEKKGYVFSAVSGSSFASLQVTPNTAVDDPKLPDIMVGRSSRVYDLI
jgi:hypothetical protein